MLQVRYFGALPVQHQGNNVSRKAVWRACLWFRGSDCIYGFARFTAGGQRGVEEFNLLRHTVFRYSKVFRFEISDGLALLVFDDHIETYEV